MLGKSIPVTVYELIGSNDEPVTGLVSMFDVAHRLYKEREWEKAAQTFAALLERFPTDRPSRIYLERCGYFASTPPPEDWDGVFNRLDK